jgi:hypothetical protein
MDERQVSAWISDDRFASFLAVAGGDFERAEATYRWHVELSASVFALVHGLEVLVRNTVDGLLGAGQPQAPVGETWLFDFDLLQPWAIKQSVVAVERFGKDVAVTRSRVVAGLSFGFWAALFGRRYEDLWRSCLHRAFPHAVGGREGVGERMRRIHRLRNRIAHHDSLLGVDVEEVARDVAAVAGWVDPAAAAWLRRVGRVEAVLARRP